MGRRIAASGAPAYQASGRATWTLRFERGGESPGFVDVAFQDKAEAGAKLLAADVNAIGVTYKGPIRILTVVGHSYGSTTTSLALQREGMVVSRAVLIGSPGGGGQAKSVADLKGVATTPIEMWQRAQHRRISAFGL